MKKVIVYVSLFSFASSSLAYSDSTLSLVSRPAPKTQEPAKTPAAPEAASDSNIPASASLYHIDEWNAWLIEALKAAEDFVRLIDQGRYAESWTRGAKLFQKTITQKEWSVALQLARQPLGAVRSRSLKDERPALDPKGLPKGPYMVVEYNTSFEKAPQSGELLTLMREADGTWKVLTYQVN
jgi:hypothetical protein